MQSKPRSVLVDASRRLDRRLLVAVFAGGVLGALARTAVGDARVTTDGSGPGATFLVNMVGAALLGHFTTRLQERLPLSAYRRPFLGTGVCGALTTFSTMQIELLRMLDADHYGLALGYCAASVTLGFLTLFLATGLTRRARLQA